MIIPSIVEFVEDPQLLGLTVSPAQRTALKSFYGLPLTQEETELWTACTGRLRYPGTPFPEGTFVCGARSGKNSRIQTPIGLYETLFGGHDQALHKGEYGICPLVAQDQRATRIAFSYIKGYVLHAPLLAAQVDDITAQEIRFTNRLSIVCFPCTQGALRGWSIPFAGMDELAFWRLEGMADSDVEVQASIRRGMLNFPHPKLVKSTTPYMKSGIVYYDFKQYYGTDSPDVLVWRASSALMNPSVQSARLAEAQRVDPSRFAREYLAEFAEDLDNFLPLAVIESCVVQARRELGPSEKYRYSAACDPTGGSTGPGRDTFTCTIVHTEGEGDAQRVVQDVLKGWRSSGAHGVDLAGIVKEIATLLQRYRLHEIRGDRYGGEWIKQAFEREGIRYLDADMTKSEAYLEAEPWFTQGRVEILDHPELVRELSLLERRPRAQGRVQVDHPSGCHDDFANALCLALAALARGPMVPTIYVLDATRIC